MLSRKNKQPVNRRKIHRSRPNSPLHARHRLNPEDEPMTVLKTLPNQADEVIFQAKDKKYWCLEALSCIYLKKLAQRSIMREKLLQRIRSGSLKIMCCREESIPKELKYRYQQKLLMTSLIDLFKWLGDGFKVESVKKQDPIQCILQRLDNNLHEELATRLLLRSLLIQALSSYNPVDLLGNQLAILTDYQQGLEYRLLTIASNTFNTTIQCSNITGSQTSIQNYVVGRASHLLRAQTSERAVTLTVQCLEQDFQNQQDKPPGLFLNKTYNKPIKPNNSIKFEQPLKFIKHKARAF